MDDFDPVAVVAVLTEHGVDFVLIGGVAATLHGSTVITEDIDITPSTDPANLDRLSDALRYLGARIRVQGIDDGLAFDHSGESLARARVWNLTTQFGDLDLSFIPSGTDGYDDLRRSAVVVDLGAVTALVASIDDVIRSKEAAGRDKDKLGLPALRYLRQAQREAGGGPEQTD